MTPGYLMMTLAIAVALGSPAMGVREAAGAPAGSSKGSGSFKPTRLENLLLWLDAADRKTLYQDAAKSKAVRTAGDPVGAWGDKSGAGRDAVQESADARPSFQPKAQNGRSAIRFDGSTNWLDADAIAPSFGAVNWTVFLAVEADLAGLGEKRGALAALMASDPKNRRARRGFQIAPTGRLEYKNRQGKQKRNVKSPHRTTGNWEIWEIVNDKGGLSIFVDGEEKISEKLEPRGDEGFSDATIGGKKLSEAAGVEDPWKGTIGEIIFYGDPKSPDERGQVRSYLSGKWGVALSAPGAGSQPKGEKQ